MQITARNFFIAVFTAVILSGTAAWGQDQATPAPVSPPQSPAQSQTQAGRPNAAAHNAERSPGGDVGSGSGDIGKGAGGAAGNVAKGTGKGAADLVTLHPVEGAGAVGTGVGRGAKDAGVGVAKGTGKIAKGTGRGIGHLFHHSHKNTASQPSSGPSTE